MNKKGGNHSKNKQNTKKNFFFHSTLLDHSVVNLSIIIHELNYIENKLTKEQKKKKSCTIPHIVKVYIDLVSLGASLKDIKKVIPTKLKCVLNYKLRQCEA